MHIPVNFLTWAMAFLPIVVLIVVLMNVRSARAEKGVIHGEDK